MNLNIKKTMGIFSLLLALIQSPCLGFLDDDEETIVRSFMPGIIKRIAVVSGQQVKKGDILFDIEAMKMLNSITAPKPGFIGPLHIMANQMVEEDMLIMTILPFMLDGENIDPMGKDKSPLLVAQDKEPFIKDIPQKNDLRKVAEPLTNPFAIDEVPDIPFLEAENEVEAMKMPISLNVSRFSFDILQDLNVDQMVEEDMSIMTILPFIPEGENIDPTDKDEPPLPIFQDKEPLVQNIPQKEGLREVAEPITSPLTIDEAPEIHLSEAEINPQMFQQKAIYPWISISSQHGIGRTRSLNDEVEVSTAFQKTRAEELGQGKNNAQTPDHLLWLTGFLLLGVLFFRRSKLITPYYVKNVLSPEVAVNWNIPRDLREAA